MPDTPSFWTPVPEGLVVAVKAQPGARGDALQGVAEAVPRPGWPPARLRVAVVARPEDGRANAAILRLLAAALGVKSSACRLVHGQAARDKLVLITGEAAALAAALRRLGLD
ncbi:MAG: DUF167 domain-containing protein [Rhodospirillales bacterium]|nr:DUF167 domain-containing protein [Rhodospirillales bacterium]